MRPSLPSSSARAGAASPSRRARPCLGLHHHQRRDRARPAGRYSQWLIGKSQDTFCPMGPVAVTRDEIDHRQHADHAATSMASDARISNTGLLIFDVPTIIATLVGRHHAAARRHHRHRHAGRRRHRLRSAEISEPRRRRARRDRRHRRAGEPLRGDRRMTLIAVGPDRRGGRRGRVPDRDAARAGRHVEQLSAADAGARRLSCRSPRPAGRGPLAAAGNDHP